MPTQFFNFGNEPTYIFFEWIRRGKQTQPLIASAYEQAEDTPD